LGNHISSLKANDVDSHYYICIRIGNYSNKPINIAISFSSAIG